jgi:integrase
MAAHKMHDGRWCVWLNLGSDPMTGRRIRKRVEARTKREAESKAAAMRERHQRGEDVTGKPRTLGELLDEWIATIELEGKAENTILAYRRASKNRIKPYLGAVEVPKLRTREIQLVVNNQLAGRLSPAYIRMIKTVLVQALDFAIDQHERSDNPAEKVRIPKVTHKPGRSLVPDEVRALLVAAEGHRYGLAIRLALMGLRRGELPGLRWEDFNEQAGTLTIGRQLQRIKKTWTAIPPKRKSARKLTLGPKAHAALLLYKRAQVVEREAMGWDDSGYIFVSTRDGGPCPSTTIYEAFRAIAKLAGIKPARLHDLRHTAATTLLGDGVDVPSVSEVLGHANSLVTMLTYAHAIPQNVANASQRLEEIFSEDDQEPKVRRRHGT